MLRYTPAKSGSWLLLALDDRFLFVRADAALPGTPPVETADLWAALASAEPVQAVLDRLTGRGLGVTPDFALGRWVAADALHILVRGEAVAVVETSAGQQRLDGAAVSTWHETTIDGASSFSVGATDTAADDLPLLAGAVWAAGATFGATSPTPAGAIANPPVALVSPTPAAVPRTAVVPPVKIIPPVAEPAEAPLPADPLPADPLPVDEHTITEVAEHDPADEFGADDVNAHDGDAHVSAASEVTTVAEPEGYDHLFEETVMRSIEDAAVRPPDENDEADAPADAEPEGDHDGHTVMSGDLAELRRGHRGASDDAPRVPESRVLFLELSTGGREVLSEPLLVGRAPSVSKVSSGQMPRLVTIPGDQDISRNHAQFALEGDTVVVTDLHSRNGTSVVLPGKAPQLLRQGEPTAVLVDTVVDLGGGVTLTVREEQ